MPAALQLAALGGDAHFNFPAGMGAALCRCCWDRQKPARHSQPLLSKVWILLPACSLREVYDCSSRPCSNDCHWCRQCVFYEHTVPQATNRGAACYVVGPVATCAACYSAALLGLALLVLLATWVFSWALRFSWGRWCCLLLGFSAEPAAPLLQSTCCLLLVCRAGPGAAGAACYLSALLVLRCCCCVVVAVCHSGALLDLVP